MANGSNHSPFTIHDSLELDAVHPHLLAQGIAVDAQHGGCMALVAPDAVQDRFDQRLFHAVDHHVVDMTRLLPVEVTEIALDRPPHHAGHIVLVVHAASTS